MLRASVIRLGVAWIGLLGFGCGRGGEVQQPTPSLSESRSAQDAFRRIVQSWFELDEPRRPELGPTLERFLVRYPHDGRVENVRLLLAWIAILSGDRASAERLVAQGRASLSPGVRDFVEVVAARLLLAQNQPDAALEKLTALESRLVDPSERLICSELRLQAALDSRRYAQALLALTAYLASAPADLGDRVRARAQIAVAGLPGAALERSLSELDLKARAVPLSPPEVWLRRVVRQRLVQLAIERKDGKLARRLLDSHPGLLQQGSAAVELLRLAASATNVAESQGAFVGLALEIGDPDAERRSASVARGLADALQAARAGADSLPIVVKASDAEHVGEVLSELSSSGALVLVAGVSDASADQAAAWAVAGSSPVLLIRDTPDLVISELSFVLGTSDMDQFDALRKELERRNLAKWARVGQGGVDCRAEPEKAGQPHFPIKEWKQAGIEAVAVLGPRGCALELFAEAREQHFAPLLALGLESAEALPALSGRRFSLGGGGFPAAESASDLPIDFYEALGHDAGSLVHQAWLEVGGAKARVEPALRARLPEVLSQVVRSLETSDATGFRGKRRLQRQLQIREAP